MVVNFAEPAKQIGPLTFVKNGKVKPLQGLRYDRPQKATSVDDAF